MTAVLVNDNNCTTSPSDEIINKIMNELPYYNIYKSINFKASIDGEEIYSQ